MPTAAGTTEDEATLYAGVDDLPAVKVSSLLRDSERIVRFMAPAPSPAPDAYTIAAKDSELRVFEILAKREDRIKKRDLGKLSITYKDDKGADPYDLVRFLMAAWIPASETMVAGQPVVVQTTVPYV